MTFIRFQTGDTLRHAKRGSTYKVADFDTQDTVAMADDQVISLGGATAEKMRAAGWDGAPVTCQIDADTPRGPREIVVYYVGEDGKGWARPKAEFHGGRFEVL